MWITASVVGGTLIRERFESFLREQARTTAGSLEALDGGIVGGRLSDEATSLLASYRSSGLFIQLRDENGDIIWQSLNLRGIMLPPAAAPPSPVVGVRLTHIESDELAKMTQGGEPLLMATIDVRSPTGQQYTLQVASDASRVESQWESMLSMLLVFALISILLAAIASWVIAGRYLAPLRSIADQAGDIDSGKLDRRVVIPHAAHEIGEVVRLMNRMLDRLEQDFIAQRRFIANVSHELKTPLTILLGEARKHIKHDSASGTNGEFLKLVAEESKRMFGIVEGFLILADASSDVDEKCAMPVEIEDVVMTAVSEARLSGRRGDVHIVPMLSDDEVVDVPVVRGDFDLLESMVLNLLENAIRHSPSGETVLVGVRPTSDGRFVDVTIRDHGPGIPESHMDRIFELFHQVEPDSGQTGTGGIGLAIARTVAVKHHGSISVSNTPGGGCEFRIRLPLSLSGVSEAHGRVRSI